MKISKQVVFPKGQYYKKNITVPAIHSYYASVLPMITKELDDTKLTLLRGIEAVRALREQEPFSILHISPYEGLAPEDLRSIIVELTKVLSTFPSMDSMQVYFDGESGYRICPYFSTPRNLTETNELLYNIAKPVLKKYVEKIKPILYKPNTIITLPYSINKNTGLAMVPVDNLDTFTPEEAKITKYIKSSFSLIEPESGDVPAIGIDFDGTLFLPYGEDYYKGFLNEDVADIAVYAKEAGYKIIIFTARIVDHPEDTLFISEFLTAHNVPFDEITAVKKPEIKIIVDDKAIKP